MQENKVTIEIPRADEKEVVTIPSGEFGEIKKKFERIDQILFGVMLSVVLSLVAIIVSVLSLFVDQMRYNNAAYKEYSEKLHVVESLRESNSNLQEQNNINQELIIKQQKQILEQIKSKE
jgi:predicted PurR-regulated permease PerM